MKNEPWSLSRRKFLVSSAASGLAGLAATTFNRGSAIAAQAAASQEGKRAFDELVAGNQRFAEGKTKHAHQSGEWRHHLLGSQKPIATLLGCSDSRVPPELVFDQGLGDLFVIRVAGNVVAPDIVGSLDYALEHLQTPLIVVLGHRNCGAVTAAVQAMSDPQMRELPAIRSLINLIEPGLKGLDMRPPIEQRIAAAVEANVRWSLRQLGDHSVCKKLLAEKKCLLTGGVYDLDTGLVRFLRD